jgi:hypothetical protein
MYTIEYMYNENNSGKATVFIKPLGFRYELRLVYIYYTEHQLNKDS